MNMDRFSGINVKPGDAEALAEAIATVLSNSHLYERLSQGARQRYETMFTKELMTELCLNLYRMILSNNDVRIENQYHLTTKP